MANVTVSVIMPVYGVEDYVGGAIESIQAQTLTDWELFCVDDGSKDRSGEVCDSYAAKDPRIHVIHKENGGAPSARNVAIDKAEGKYLYFCDADDWAEKTMLEDMVSIAEENGSQLVVAGFYIDTYYSDTEKFTQCQEVPSRVFATQREFREHAHELFDQNLLVKLSCLMQCLVQSFPVGSLADANGRTGTGRLYKHRIAQLLFSSLDVTVIIAIYRHKISKDILISFSILFLACLYDALVVAVCLNLKVILRHMKVSHRLDAYLEL